MSSIRASSASLESQGPLPSPNRRRSYCRPGRTITVDIDVDVDVDVIGLVIVAVHGNDTVVVIGRP
jgi:hypothetical protein